MSSLMEKMLKIGTIKSASVLADSDFFDIDENDIIDTGVPILNLAFSGDLDGGLMPGVTTIAGASKTFKSLLGLLCLRGFLEKNKDGIGIIYDSEGGMTPEYLSGIGIDTNRILHVPIVNVEELKFDMVSKLKELSRKDNAFFLLDSLGNLASLKEVEDAENAKSVADMSRAKAIKSLFRIITPQIVSKKLHCVVINHVYSEIGMFPKDIVGGGTGSMYSSNQVFIITKAQEKDGADLRGWKFTLGVEKSRYVREKSKFPLTVMYEKGIMKNSGMFDFALGAGYVQKATSGWYNVVDLDTGEVQEKKLRKKEIEDDREFFAKLMCDDQFKNHISEKYKLQDLFGEE